MEAKCTQRQGSLGDEGRNETKQVQQGRCNNGSRHGAGSGSTDERVDKTGPEGAGTHLAQGMGMEDAKSSAEKGVEDMGS